MSRWGWLVTVATGCSFPANAGFEPRVDAPPVDTPGDTAVPIDMSTTPQRTGSPRALWRFDESAGVTAGDSVVGQPITLTLPSGAGVTWGGGGLRFDARTSAVSAPTPHVNRDVRLSNAVTLEAWVTPAVASQGANNYAVIASTSVSVMLRNIALEQRGAAWVGRVRTTATTGNAEPAIIATAPIDTAMPTHLVLVADATSRVLYVNGEPFTSPGAEGVMSGWDPNYKLRIGDEDSADRHWLGTLWLLAIHDAALTADEVMQNYRAGHDCSGC
ncbi:MAG: LamG domain-containing protein [Deltaproteobacteria bacterium]|nr:LamG domain-containing protein [Deltaproteobacteria bacterium]